MRARRALAAILCGTILSSIRLPRSTVLITFVTTPDMAAARLPRSCLRRKELSCSSH